MSRSDVRVDEGELPSGSRFAVAVPDAWNGVLINDLDFVDIVTDDPGMCEPLLDLGFALSGTRRVRVPHYDIGLDLDNQLRALDEAERRVGSPSVVVQNGRSRGAMIALAMGERHPGLVDGVVANCGTSVVVMAAMCLDLAFCLRQLLAPGGDLPVIKTAFLLDERNATGELAEELAEPVSRWRRALADAQSSPIGRARIALALTVAQWPAWGSAAHTGETSGPDPRNLDAVQDAMYRCAVAGIEAAIAGQQCTSQGVPAGNSEVDYSAFLANADAAEARVVRRLYRLAGPHPERAIEADLARLAEAERVTAPPERSRAWRGRTPDGRLGAPVLHLTSMDAGVPPVSMRGYGELVGEAGRDDLYRQAAISRAGHCAVSPGEYAAAIESVVRRIEDGRWGDTDPEALGRLARELGEKTPRFAPVSLPRHHNRATPLAEDEAQRPRSF